MEIKNRVSNKFLALFLILCTSRVCQSQLVCYVCEDCAQVTSQTTQVECNEEYFNTSGQTGSSVQTTTEHPKTTPGATDGTDSTMSEEMTTTSAVNNTEETTVASTTELKSPEHTAKTTNGNVTETSTEAMIEPTTLRATQTTFSSSSNTEEQSSSSPHTLSSPAIITFAQTTPNTGTTRALDDVESLNNGTAAHDQRVNRDEVEIVDIEHGTTAKPYKPSAEFRVRQLRSVSDVTFYCFKVQATATNGTMIVNRGCSRVQTNETVCGQWEAQHSNEKMNKCYPCSLTKCNGSSAISVSITALIVAAIALFMHRK